MLAEVKAVAIDPTVRQERRSRLGASSCSYGTEKEREDSRVKRAIIWRDGVAKVEDKSANAARMDKESMERKKAAMMDIKALVNRVKILEDIASTIVDRRDTVSVAVKAAGERIVDVSLHVASIDSECSKGLESPELRNVVIGEATVQRTRLAARVGCMAEQEANTARNFIKTVPFEQVEQAKNALDIANNQKELARIARCNALGAVDEVMGMGANATLQTKIAAASAAEEAAMHFKVVKQESQAAKKLDYAKKKGATPRQNARKKDVGIPKSQ
jgi:hypothetical protein